MPPYQRPNIVSGVTRANKPFFDNLLDGIDEKANLGEGNVARFATSDVAVVTNFDPGHGYTIQSAGGGSSNLNDTTHALFGSQSIRITTAGAGASVIVQKLGDPPIPVGRMLRIRMVVDAPDTLARVRALVSDDPAFTRYYELESVFSSAGIPEVQRPFKAGEPVTISLPWATVKTTGTPDRNALTNLRLLFNDRSSGAIANVHIERIETVPDPVPVFPDGVVTMTYDDSFVAHYLHARAHLDRYDMPGVAFPIFDRIGQPGYMTWAQLDALAHVNGWEIGGHATTYDKHVQSLTGMTSAERLAELRGNKAIQQARGYVSTSFAYPNGLVDAATELDLRKFYGAGRLALGRFSATGSDEMQIPSMPTRMYGQNCGNLSVAQIQAEIDRAKTNKTWLILMFHNLVTTKVDANDFTIANHSTIVDYLKSSGIAVATIDQVRLAGLAAAAA